MFSVNILFMTILEAFEKLNEFFSTNSTFSLDENFRDIISISENEPHEKAAILCALNELQASDILRSTDVSGVKYWVLFKPLESFDQQVEISYLLAAGISSVINNVCDIVGNASDKCDPKQITEKDLQNLLLVASKVSEQDLKE